MTNLQIQLFGGLYISVDGESVTAVHQPRRQSLLAYLMLHPRTPQPRRHLSFLFWPDSAEAQARTNLRKALYNLRQNLPESNHLLQSNANMVQWTPDATLALDVTDFENALSQADVARRAEQLAEAKIHLAKAISLYRGELLPDCYDNWIFTERERLHMCALTALEQLMYWLEQSREYASAIPFGRRLLALDPVHEATYRHLMRLHALNGDRAGALRVYHTCADLLQQELGVTPNADTQEVYSRLLQTDTIAAPSMQPGQRIDTSHMVGRKREWQQLQTAWRRATKMQSRFALVAGEAGIGKSFLVAQMRHWATQQGISTAHARAYIAEGGLAYGPVIEWLRSEPIQANLDCLDRVWLRELARLLPELRTADPTLPRPGPLTEPWQRQRLYDALVHAIMLAKSPLLLVLDDLQWCDGETLEWLHFLLCSGRDSARQTVTATHILVIGTVRPNEVDEQHPLTRLCLDLHRTDQITETELGPLTADETAVMATQVAEHELDGDAHQRLFAASEGNPLFVVEMVRAGSWAAESGAGKSQPDQLPNTDSLPLPPKVYAVIRYRLAQLSPAARQLANLAATIGRSFTFDTLAEVSDASEEELIKGLDELWQRRIVRELGSTAYDFSHDRIRDVAYAEIGSARRRYYHKRLVQALTALNAGDIDAISGQLGLHSERANRLANALTYYYQAVDTAVELYAFESALFYLERILVVLADLPVTAERTQQRVESWLKVTKILIITKGWTATERKQALDEAYELAKESDNQVLLVDARNQLAGYLTNIGEQYKTYELSKEALAHAKTMEDRPRLCHAYCSIAGSNLNLGDYGSSMKYYGLAQEMAGEIGPDYWRIKSRSRMVETLWASGYPDQARELAIDSIRMIDELADPFGRVHEREFIMYVHQRIGDLAATKTLAEEIGTLVDRYGFPNYALTNQLFAGWVATQSGAPEEGLDQISRSLEGMEKIEDRFYRSYFLALLAEAQAENDQLADALDTLAQAQSFAHQSGERGWEAEILRLTGEFRLRLDATDTQAEQCLQAGLTVARRQCARMLELRAATSLARLWHSQGKAVAAHDLLAPIYAWFSEGFDTPDLRAAEALLNQLDRQRPI